MNVQAFAKQVEEEYLKAVPTINVNVQTLASEKGIMDQYSRISFEDNVRYGMLWAMIVVRVDNVLHFKMISVIVRKDGTMLSKIDFDSEQEKLREIALEKARENVFLNEEWPSH